MPVTVNVNGLSLVHKGSEGVAISTMPDVCLTPAPGGPIPLPYPNIARSDSLADGSSSVTADGQMIAVKGSQFSQSTGDESGTAGGVKSGTNMKEATWLSYSPDVKIEGKNACRLTDKMLMNHGNTACLAGEQQQDLSEEKVDCQAEWEKYEKQTHQISDIDDPVERNKKISAAYAQMYEQNTSLRWSGAAAFASKQVGCALNSARSMMESPLPFVSGPAEAMYSGLGAGNRAVFEEIYPVMKFYDDHGMTALQTCKGSREPPVSNELVNGLRLVDQGDLQRGAMLMLYHEQSVTLQRTVYDNPAFQRAIGLNQLAYKSVIGRLFGAQPIKANFSAECDAADELIFKGSDFSDMNERWPFVQDVLNGFAGQNPVSIDQQLRIIIERGAGAVTPGGGGGSFGGGGAGGAW